MKKKTGPLTDREKKYIVDKAMTRTAAQIAQALGRSVKAVIKAANNFGVEIRKGEGK